MRKGAMLLLALILLLALAVSANAWVRSRMYDAGVPVDPSSANAEFIGWGTAESEGIFEVGPGEIVGGQVGCRFSFGTNSKLKYRTDNQPAFGFDNTKLTSVVWSFYIVDTAQQSTRCPQIYIRLNTGGVQFAYTCVSDVGPRGWYIQKGTVTSGGQIIGNTGSLGLPMEPGQWHTMRLTLDPATRAFDLWLDDGIAGHLTGTADTSGGSYIQWPKIDRTSTKTTCYVSNFWWGQGTDQIDPIPGGGAQWDMTNPIVSVAPDGTYADVTWATENPSDTRVVWGKDFYSFPNAQAVSESVTNHSYRINGLVPNATYTFYCTSSDISRTWASGVKQFQTPVIPTSAIANPSFEEGAHIYPWVDAVPPTGGQSQRWGGNFLTTTTNVGPLAPRTGRLWSGNIVSGDVTRDWACIGQQVAVTPGKAYRVKAWFCDVLNPYDPAAGTVTPWDYVDAQGRVGLDPTGGTEAGYMNGTEFVSDPDVYWGEWAYTTQQSIQWKQASAVAVAQPATPPQQSLMAVYLQHRYKVDPILPWYYLAFDDVTIEEAAPPPTTCGECKTSSPGYPVTLQGVVVTLRQGIGDDIYGYVEDADSKAGIKVQCSDMIWPDTMDVGTPVDVAGALAVNSDKELYVAAKSITTAASGGTIYARGMTNAALGGATLGLQAGVEGGSGANNVGLLARTWGRVTAVYPPDSFDAFSVMIDDGSNLVAGMDDSTTTYPGIEVRIPANAGLSTWSFVPGQTYVLVTGISSVKTWTDPVAGPVQKRQILIRDADDVQFSIF